jgi:hypothetical protein
MAQISILFIDHEQQTKSLLLNENLEAIQTLLSLRAKLTVRLSPIYRTEARCDP